MDQKSIRVAVIGAGFSGLVAARELQRESHDVVVFEKSDRIGGTWVYDPRTETDPLSLDSTREILHSSMYESLRTNLPRHLLGFSDYPLTPRESGNPRTFPGREEVLRFLDGFAADFDLIKLIRFGSEVVRVEKSEKETATSSRWSVEWRTSGAAATSIVEVFEAVVVCNGHNTHPRIAEFPGRSNWSGKQVHSHNYRIPEPYKDQIVVVIGNGPSAMDISKDILPFAKEVHQASRSTTAAQNPEPEFKSSGVKNIVQHPMIQCAEEDGKLVFEDGSSLYADIILHCTGYSFRFPFLRTNNIVTVDNNRVGPLYKHVFPPSLAPSLSFIGLNNLGVTPVLFELQCKWVARVLSGKMFLPDEEEMMVSVEEHYKQMEEMGCPKHHTHRLQKHDYERWLADILELPPPEKWREEMFLTLFTLRDKYGEDRLDKWDADKWLKDLKTNECFT